MTTGSLFKLATHSTVNYWLQNTYTSMMLGTSMSGYFINIIVLLCIGAAGLSAEASASGMKNGGDLDADSDYGASSFKENDEK